MEYSDTGQTFRLNCAHPCRCMTSAITETLVLRGGGKIEHTVSFSLSSVLIRNRRIKRNLVVAPRNPNFFFLVSEDESGYILVFKNPHTCCNINLQRAQLFLPWFLSINKISLSICGASVLYSRLKLKYLYYILEYFLIGYIFDFI